MLKHKGDFDHVFHTLPDELPKPDAFYAKAYFASLDMAGADTESYLLGYAQALYDCGLADRTDLMRIVRAIAKGSCERAADSERDCCPKCGKSYYNRDVINSVADEREAAWWVAFRDHYHDAKKVLLDHYGLTEDGKKVSSGEDADRAGNEGGDGR